jgi:hypothetical protein
MSGNQLRSSCAFEHSGIDGVIHAPSQAMCVTFFAGRRRIFINAKAKRVSGAPRWAKRLAR